VAFGDDESISKNNETINNPAIAAPIIMVDPIHFLRILMHAGFQFSRVFFPTPFAVRAS
jgi:hypothetical protein